MEDLSSQINNLRLKYRDIFRKTFLSFQSMIDSFKPENFDGEIFDRYENSSPGKKWQQDVLEYINEKSLPEIKSKFKNIQCIKEEYECRGCGICCKLACSEYSPQELKQKAMRGDSFAQQFIQTFVPYGTVEEAEKIFPEYIKMLNDEKESDYYFYHCPKVTEDNRCPDYENRPQICKDFPDNPLAFLPLNCGYTNWKKETEDISLKANAQLDTIKFFKDKIEEVQI